MIRSDWEEKQGRKEGREGTGCLREEVHNRRKEIIAI